MLELEIHDVSSRPSIFHITQHKCASQWLAEVLKYCAYRRVVLPRFGETHFNHSDVRLVQGLIYPTLYVTKESFEEVIKRNSHISSYKAFVVIRDLRDILISLYFSVKNSHESGFQAVDEHRVVLNKSSMEDGLIFLLDTQMRDQTRMQSSWMGSEYRIFKFEDLTNDDEKTLLELLQFCEIDVEESHFKLVMDNNRFSALAGRERGKENVNHHYRKGVARDWVKHFTPKVKEEFKSRYAQNLIDAGYEADDLW